MCEMEGDMAVYGYARVSTDGQSLSAQLAELKAAKCEKIFQEKITGARSDRKGLSAADGGPGERRCIGRHQARSTGEVHARSPQTAGDDCRKRSWLQIASGYVGRHDYSARSLDADRIGGIG
jgi:hypothetical protein